MRSTQPDDLISALKDDLARVRAELAITNSRVSWFKGYVEGRDSVHTPAFLDAIEEGLAASRRGDVVTHDVILNDIRERRAKAHNVG